MLESDQNIRPLQLSMLINKRAKSSVEHYNGATVKLANAKCASLSEMCNSKR